MYNKIVNSTNESEFIAVEDHCGFGVDWSCGDNIFSEIGYWEVLRYVEKHFVFNMIIYDFRNWGTSKYKLNIIMNIVHAALRMIYYICFCSNKNCIFTGMYLFICID